MATNKYTKWPDAMRAKCYNLWLERMSAETIAAETNVPRCTIRAWARIDKWDERRKARIERSMLEAETHLMHAKSDENAELVIAKRATDRLQLEVTKNSDEICRKIMDVQRVVLKALDGLEPDDFMATANDKGTTCMSKGQMTLNSLADAMMKLSRVTGSNSDVANLIAGTTTADSRHRKTINGVPRVQNNIFQIGVKPLDPEPITTEAETTEGELVPPKELIP